MRVTEDAQALSVPEALAIYRQAADEATDALWLPHRRDLLAAEDGRFRCATMPRS